MIKLMMMIIMMIMMIMMKIMLLLTVLIKTNSILLDVPFFSSSVLCTNLIRILLLSIRYIQE